MRFGGGELTLLVRSKCSFSISPLGAVMFTERGVQAKVVITASVKRGGKICMSLYLALTGLDPWTSFGTSSLALHVARLNDVSQSKLFGIVHAHIWLSYTTVVLYMC